MTRPATLDPVVVRAAQRITGLGDQDLVFLAICSPPFTQQAYEEIATEP